MSLKHCWLIFLPVFLYGKLLAGAGSDSIPFRTSKLARVVFNLDSRYSWINGQQVQIGGIKLGIEWKERVRTGIGFYGLSSELYNRISLSRDHPDDLVDARFRFNYFALYGEYILYRNRRWEFSLPLQLGAGSFNYEFRDPNGNPRETRQKPIALIEPSLSGHYKVFNWIGIGAGMGYRQMLSSAPKIEHNFDSPIYYIKLKIFLGYLYMDLFHNRKGLTKMQKN